MASRDRCSMVLNGQYLLPPIWNWSCRHGIIAGDFNAKHPSLGCNQTNQRGPNLHPWIEDNNVNALNSRIKTSLRSDITNDLIMSTDTAENVKCRTLPYDCGDHLPLLAVFPRLKMTIDKTSTPRTYWKVYTPILSVLRDYLEYERENFPNTAELFNNFEHSSYMQSNFK